MEQGAIQTSFFDFFLGFIDHLHISFDLLVFLFI